MRKSLLFVIFVLSWMCSYAQQSLPNEFFGLKFEETYSLEEMKEHVGNKGTFVQETGTIEMGTTNYNGYVFSNASHDNRHYPLMTLMTLEHGTFGGISFTFTKDSASTDSTLEIIYNELKDSLIKQYGELVEFPIEEQSDVSRLMSLQNGVALRLDKWVNENGITDIEVSYISLIAILADAYKVTYPTIQDTFLGLKIGSRQTTFSIKSAVGYKGEYLDEQLNSYGKIITFTKMIFAGKTWDFGSFSLTDKGELYSVCVYDSLKDGFGYDDEQNDAKQTYDSYKIKLDDKYGVHDEKESSNGKYIVYIGGNDIAIILSNERSKSAGGKYRRYVKIEYYHTAIYNKLSEQSTDEL